jgi:hypothetical protein
MRFSRGRKRYRPKGLSMRAKGEPALANDIKQKARPARKTGRKTIL